jgi:hypothetical protein
MFPATPFHHSPHAHHPASAFPGVDGKLVRPAGGHLTHLPPPSCHCQMLRCQLLKPLSPVQYTAVAIASAIFTIYAAKAVIFVATAAQMVILALSANTDFLVTPTHFLSLCHCGRYHLHCCLQDHRWQHHQSRHCPSHHYLIPHTTYQLHRRGQDSCHLI